MHPLRTRFLIFLGMTIIAIGAYLRQLSQRSGHATDTSDFHLGVLAGIGLGLLLLGVWRASQSRRRSHLQ